MSAALQLNADQLENLSNALREFSTIRRRSGIGIGGYGDSQVEVIGADVVLRVRWDDDRDEYVLNDRYGD